MRRQRRVRVASYLLAMARACATKRSLSSWTSYKEGLVDSGKSCGVLVVSPLIALMHAYAVCLRVKPNPFNTTGQLRIAGYRVLGREPTYRVRVDDVLQVQQVRPVQRLCLRKGWEVVYELPTKQVRNLQEHAYCRL